LDDIDELSVIAIELWQLAWEFGELSASEQYKYNKEMTDWIVKQLKLWVPYNKAEANTQAVVEPKYWEYRVHQETKNKYVAFCNRLDNYIKFLMHKNKVDIMAENAANRF
jgi:hypothetical protein